jgi:two-component system, NarL family, nitrate/nitrite response regulator NarL
MIRLLHVEPNTVMRTVLRDLVELDDLEVVASVARLSELPPEQAAGLEADLLLVSLDGTENAPDRVRQWRRRAGRVKVLALLADDGLDRMVSAVQAGFEGILLAEEGPAAVGRAIALVAMGEKVLPPRLASLLEVPATEDAARRGSRSLTPIERVVLRYLQAGSSNQQIAASTGQDEADVKVQVHSIFRKLKVRNRTQAALWAARNPDLLLAEIPQTRRTG